MSSVRIGGKLVGDGQPVFILAEIGINHSGDVDIAATMIDVAATAGCDAVKFQKRTIDVVYTKEELDKPRESPYGTTNRELKEHLEFDWVDYRFIDATCREAGIPWLASCWDEQSVDFIQQFDPPAYKIASASLTDTSLLRHTASTGKPIILSTGMSRLEQIDQAVGLLEAAGNPLILLHCVSTYPSENHQLNLRCLQTLRDRYRLPVGYSGHEHGLATTVAAVAMGACLVERHITLDRSMWGSDQAASLEPAGLERLVRDIRAVEEALGNGNKAILPEEQAIMKKLRRVG
jgi:N-acetylneuraminate synthase